MWPPIIDVAQPYIDVNLPGQQGLKSLHAWTWQTNISVLLRHCIYSYVSANLLNYLKLGLKFNVQSIVYLIHNSSRPNLVKYKYTSGGPKFLPWNLGPDRPSTLIGSDPKVRSNESRGAALAVVRIVRAFSQEWESKRTGLQQSRQAVFTEETKLHFIATLSEGVYVYGLINNITLNQFDINSSVRVENYVYDHCNI